MKKIFYLSACLFAFAVTGCKKNQLTQLSNPATGAQIKFVHVAPGTFGLDGFVNTSKLTPATVLGITDNQVAASTTTGLTYLNVFPGSNYSITASGNTALKYVLTTNVPALVSPQTSAPGVTFGTATQATVDGGAYTAFAIGLPGSAATPLTLKVVEDKFPAATANKAYVRFANFIPNAPALDLSGTFTATNATTATTAIIAGNLAYGTLSDFIPVTTNPISTTGYTFQLYTAGTTTKVGSVTAVISLTPGRYYTLMARGLYADYAVPGTSITLKATDRPKLPVTDPATKLPEIYFNSPGITYYTNK